jgi:hypothetical protein
MMQEGNGAGKKQHENRQNCGAALPCSDFWTGNAFHSEISDETAHRLAQINYKNLPS